MTRKKREKCVVSAALLASKWWWQSGLISHKDSQLRNMPFTNLKKKVLVIIVYCQILALFFKFVNGILRNWESLCEIRSACHHHFDASGTSNAMFDELAERCLMSPLAGTKHTYVRLATIVYCQILAPFFFQVYEWHIMQLGILMWYKAKSIIIILGMPILFACLCVEQTPDCFQFISKVQSFTILWIPS